MLNTDARHRNKLMELFVSKNKNKKNKQKTCNRLHILANRMFRLSTEFRTNFITHVIITYQFGCVVSRYSIIIESNEHPHSTIN